MAQDPATDVQTTKKYLDYDGLLYFWQKIKTKFLSQTDASNTYLTKSEAGNTYQTISIASPNFTIKTVEGALEQLQGEKYKKPNTGIPASDLADNINVSKFVNDAGYITQADIPPESVVASNTTPKADSGTGVKGTENQAFARGDHQHPLQVDRTTNPLMDGTASPGGSSTATYALSDHVHPNDTSKQNVNLSSATVAKFKNADTVEEGLVEIVDNIASLQGLVGDSTLAGVKINGTAMSITDRIASFNIKENGTNLTVSNNGIDINVPITTVKLNGAALTPDSNHAVNITAYQKPTNGIPGSDLTSTVQESLAKADTAIQVVKFNGTSLTKQTGQEVAFAIKVDGTNATVNADGNIKYINLPITQMIADAIGQIDHLHYEIVSTLPATGASDTIYMVPAETELIDDVYIEWFYINNAWEKVGSTRVDLSNYIQFTDLVAITNNEIDTITSN